ncbi:MAG: FKBP-type peptidyl-prolyl cis-trans isomerase [Candidatus Latescibacter sp.]|nr:FKBP-type peptidyl-prolyl cis-trans isomerase [Candidatus Latescibacter sp.]
MQEAKALRFLLSALLISSLPLVACSNKGGGKAEFKNDVDKASYAIGMQIGRNFKDNKIDPADLNLAMFQKGITDILDNKATALPDSDIAKVMDAFSTKLKAKQETALKKEKSENQAKASAFLAENAKKTGVITLPPDSLQYTVMKEGAGPMPKPTDTVKILYKGTLIDGTEFDSSQVHGGQPIEFPVNQVIPGWTEIIPMMKVGSKWKVFIPPKLAYGERATPKIGANSLLIFEIELLEISPPAPTSAQAPDVKLSPKPRVAPKK